METHKNANAAILPEPVSDGDNHLPGVPDVVVDHPCGISLRDHFAAQALRGLLSSGCAFTWEECAVRAYEIADAMLERRGS